MKNREERERERKKNTCFLSCCRNCFHFFKAFNLSFLDLLFLFLKKERNFKEKKRVRKEKKKKKKEKKLFFEERRKLITQEEGSPITQEIHQH